MVNRTLHCCRAESVDSQVRALGGICISYAFAPHQPNGLGVIGFSFRRLAMEDLSRLKLTQEGRDDAAHKSNANHSLRFWFGRCIFSTGLCVKSGDVEGYREHSFFTQTWGTALKLSEEEMKHNRRNT